MTILAALADFFVNPWLLGGLVLLAAPVIIHLLNKRRFEVVDWAAMDFLLAAQAQNRRRIRFEDLLLLLLRMALVALIVFAVSRPLLHGVGSTQEDERFVVIDDSFSMLARDGTGTAFEMARAQAIRSVEEAVGLSLPVEAWSGTQARSVQPGTVAPAMAGSGAPDGHLEEASRLLTALRGMPVSDRKLDFAGVVTLLSDRSASTEPRARSLYLLSDLRRHDWFAPGGGIRGDVRAALSRAAKVSQGSSLHCHLVHVGRADAENAAIVDVRVDGDHPLVGVPVRFVVEVRNLGDREIGPLRGDLEVGTARPRSAVESNGFLAGGASSREQLQLDPGGVFFEAKHRVPLPSIEAIAPGESATSSVELTFEEPGDYPLVARMQTDALAVDDVSFAVATVRDGLRTVIVDGDPGRGHYEGEAGFVWTALVPGGIRAGFAPQVIDGAIVAADLAASDVVLVLNRERFAAEELRLLRGFVENGGGLGFFLGNRVSAEAYREAFGEGSESEVLFRARLGEVITVPSDTAERVRAHLRVSDWEHSGFSVFRGVAGASLEQVGFDRYFEVTPRAGAQVLARFDDDAETPAVLEWSAVGTKTGEELPEDETEDAAGEVERAPPSTAEAGAEPTGTGIAESSATLAHGKGRSRGRIALFNMSADRDWGDWPTDPSYLIVLQSWIRHLAPTAGERRRVSVGEPLTWQTLPGLRYEVLTPLGARHEVQVNAGELASYIDVNDAGLYCVQPSLVDPRLSVDPEVLRPLWFAACRDPRESDLHPADFEMLRAGLVDTGVRVTLSGHLSGGAGDGEGETTSGEGSELWRGAALAAGLFLLLELFVAWWFGRRSS